MDLCVNAGHGDVSLGSLCSGSVAWGLRTGLCLWGPLAWMFLLTQLHLSWGLQPTSGRDVNLAAPALVEADSCVSLVTIITASNSRNGNTHEQDFTRLLT